eukprot:1125317-Amorphochlora_amoeboformis.AAC.1
MYDTGVPPQSRSISLWRNAVTWRQRTSKLGLKMTDKLRLTDEETNISGKLSLLFNQSVMVTPEDSKDAQRQMLRSLEREEILNRSILQDVHLTEAESGMAKRHSRYQESVKNHFKILHKALDLCHGIDSSLMGLNQNYMDVSQKTSKVDTDCQALLKEQEQLSSTARDLREKLQYFNHAHYINSKVKTNDLAMKMVNSPELHNVLQKLDKSIQFMQANSQWKEAQRYLGVFIRLQEKVLNTVKLYFTAQLRTAVAALRQGTDGDKSSIKMASAKAFVEFQTVASKLKPLIQSIQDKASNSPQYELLLESLHQTFVMYRLKLLKNEVQMGWRHDIEHLSLIEAVRHGCGFIINTLTFEYQLFEHFFEVTESAKATLHGLLSRLASMLYSGLRPVLIQELELEPISQAILVLRKEILEQQVLPRGEALSQFVPVINRLLADMQLRLAYRAQIFINEQIAGYEPIAVDLNYPACLENARQSKPPVSKPADESQASNAKQDGKESKALTISKLWFPTLGKTVMCLFKLHECVEPGAFSHLAQEAILHCNRSLQLASKKIGAKQGRLHGQLFLIKYLLILR